MSDETLYPRPAVISFGATHTESERYAAPLGKPFAQQRPLTATGTPHVEHAFTSKQGDTLFSINTGDEDIVNFPSWYMMPKGGTVAYRLMNTLSRGGMIDVEFEMDTNTNNGEHRAKLYSDGKSVTFNGEPLTAVPEAEKNTLLAASLGRKITFIDFPQVRYIDRAHRLPDGEWLLVSTHGGQLSPDAVRVFRGFDLQHLREIPVLQVQDFPYNGTTTYKTAEGVLHAPMPYTFPADASWMPANAPKPIALTLESPAAIEQQIVRDTRLIGVPTWEEYSAARHVSSPDDRMQKSLEEFHSSGPAAGGSTPRGKAQDKSRVPLP